MFIKSCQSLKIPIRNGISECIFAALFFALLASSTCANEEVVEIPEIVITAEKTEQTNKSTAATVSILSAAEMDKGSVSTFDQALESVPGIMLNRSAGTATNSMSIRGASDTLGGGVGNRVLLLLDGRPAITADTGGANWSLLPIEIVERVEVVKGALSPLYGSNAMGGVVNFITKVPGNVRDTKINIGWGYFDRQPEVDKRSYFENIALSHSNSYGSFGYLLSLSGKASDGYRQNTDFSLYNAYGKFQYTNQKDLKLSLALGRTFLERGYPNIWLIDSISPYVHPMKVAYEKTNDRQEKRIWDADLLLKSPVNSRLKLSANLYHSQNCSRSLFNPDNLEGDDRPYGFYTDSDAKKSGGLLQIDIFPLFRNYLILGLDAQLDSVDSNPADVMFGSHKSMTLAGFAQDRIAISNELAVMLGARYDHRYLEGGKNEGQMSPKFGLSYKVNDNTALRLSAGQAFRAPSLAEMYMKQEIHSGVDFRENPNLRSEKLRLYAEVGVKHNLTSFLKTDISAFMYNFSDMIVWKALDENEYQVTNLSRAVMRGIETSLAFSWNKISAVANYTYLDAKDRTEGRTDDTLPYKAKHTAYMALDYQYRRFKPGASIRYVSKMEEVTFYPNDAPEAFYVVNAYISCSLSDRMILSVAVNNLLDRQYEEMARYRMPGRSVAFKVIID